MADKINMNHFSCRGVRSGGRRKDRSSYPNGRINHFTRERQREGEWKVSGGRGCMGERKYEWKGRKFCVV